MLVSPLAKTDGRSIQDSPASVDLNIWEFSAANDPLSMPAAKYRTLGLAGANAIDIRSTRRFADDTGRPLDFSVQVRPASVDFSTRGDEIWQAFLAHHLNASQVTAYITAGLDGSRAISVTSW